MGEQAISVAAKRAEDAVREYVRRRFPHAKIFSFGAINIDPVNLAIWVTTDTDLERDELSADAALLTTFRGLMADAGYPREAIGGVGFAFESEETVNRDFGGNWWACVK